MIRVGKSGRCGARVRWRVGFCRRFPVPGRTRCRLHGGNCRGPRTAEGKARSFAAMLVGRARYLERMRAAKAAGLIKKFSWGRKPGPDWITPRMRLKMAVPSIDHSEPAPLPRITRADAATPEGRAVAVEAIDRMLDNLERTGSLRG